MRWDQRSKLKFITKKIFLSSNVFKVTFEVGNSVKLSDLSRVSKKSELAAQIKSVLSQVPEFPCGFVRKFYAYKSVFSKTCPIFALVRVWRGWSSRTPSLPTSQAKGTG